MADPIATNENEPVTPAGSSAPTAPNTLSTSVTLDTPVVRGGETITALSIRRPTAGDLRGLSLQDVIRADTNAIMTLLPRVTTPSLIEAEIAALPASDFFELAGAVAGFFMTAAERRRADALMGLGMATTSAPSS